MPHPPPVSPPRAIFLDRDGVLVADTGTPLYRAENVVILPGVPEALSRLRAAGFRLIAVTNQSVVARGLISEADLIELHRFMDQRLVDAGGPALDAWYFCPHHPKATLPAYRIDCACRKPRTGLLRQAATDLGLALNASVMVGDRPTDVACGQAAGCRTVWVHTGRHLDPQIETNEPLPPNLRADHVAPDLAGAVGWILGTP